MKVFVLGASGYIGSRVCKALAETGWATPVAVSRRPLPASQGMQDIQHLRLDTREAAALARALQGADAVVNCVAGDAQSIAQGASALVNAALSAQCMRIVHLSTMSVYGSREGYVGEHAAFDPTLGWYAKAKCEAEAHITEFTRESGSAVVLRPGCVWGPGSELWVGRVGRWLRAHRLGDLGAQGDGWSNLVHVDDVVAAVLSALRMPQAVGQLRTYNLSAPDSPRWNEYFVDLAIAIGATPVRRIHPRQLKLDGYVLGPVLKAMQMAMGKLGRASLVPDPISPGLVALWDRHLKLDSRQAERDLGLQWTPYDAALRQCALWFLQSDSSAAPPPRQRVMQPPQQGQTTGTS